MAVICGFAVHAILSIQERLHTYTVITEKVHSLNTFNTISQSFYDLLVKRLTREQSADLSQQVELLQAELNRLAQQAHTELHTHHGVVATNIVLLQIDDLRYLVDDIQNAESSEIVDLGNLVFDVLVELSDEIHKISSHTVEPTIHQLDLVYSDLSWFLFWMKKEAWVAQSVARKNIAFQRYAPDYYQATERQQYYLDKFIVGADNEQLKALVSLFSQKEFRQGSVVKERMLVNKISPAEIGQYIVNLEQRYVMVSNQIGLFTQHMSDQLATTISQNRKDVFYISGAAIAVTLFLVIWGASTLYRINSKLHKILATMGRISSNNAKKIDIDGRDEFSRFARGLNRIISEQKRYEQDLIDAKESAIAANKAKSAFLANMSHEIRTPLNGIIGMTEILSESHLNSSQKDVLQDIDTSSQSLLVLLNDILDLSKIESGNLVLAPNEIDLREVVYDSVNMVSARALTKHIELTVDIDESMPDRVKADEFRVKQVLMNLLSNAVKFTTNGFITTKVEYKESPLSPAITFSVIDSGVGIDSDKLATIFKPFTQEDGSITRRYGGTGLGLTICRQLIDLMEGEIQVESTKGLGSCFSFTVPVKIPLEQSPQTSLDLSALIVTHDSVYSDSLAAECRRFGVDVALVSSVDKPYDGAFDVVLYCQVHDKSSRRDIHTLRGRYGSAEIIACQHHLFISPEVASLVSATIILPVLGQRLLKTLTKITRRTEYVDTPIEASTELPAPPCKRILIVEDNLMNQKIASFFLDKIGIEYSIASNGQEALDAVTSGGEYIAVLMDCMMPIMDGLTATKKIREWEASNGKEKLPIIALTASVLDEEIESCFAAGMDAYLPKPYKSQQLFDVFNELKLA
ncbi:ATP-binding protein [Vibrio paucivorans]